MRTHIAATLCLLVGLGGAACSSSTDRTYAIQGQVLSIDPSGHEATIKHGEIKGLMPAMTMPYRMRNATLLDGIAAGDLIKGTLVVTANDSTVTALKKVGTAPLEPAPSDGARAATSGVAVIKPGDVVPNARFVDQDGTARDFGSFRGSTVVVTFIYTRCPLPDFCPLMDRNFVSIQSAITKEPALKNVHLVSVSIDPEVDTPAMLKAHAKELNADPKRWTLLTGTLDDIDRFGASFGLSVSRPDNDAITHTLRTAVIDSSGKLVKMYVGNKWTPSEVLADLKSL